MHDEQTPEDARSQKTFLFDTSVHLFDPDALSVSEGNDLSIPITVIEAFDSLKKDLDETGWNAQMVSPHLDALRQKGALAAGAPLSVGGALRIRKPSAQTSLAHQRLLVDVPQSFTPHEPKTMLARAGEGTKGTLTGDPHQIDNPCVDATSSGLSHVVERCKTSPIAGHITPRKGGRSEFTGLATRLL
jgi:predicted ribonuclease YlaK